MSKLATQAERLKLARLLDVPGEALTALDDLDAATLRSLRLKASAAFFDADAQMFQRVAMASRLLPAAMIALVAEKVLGPMLSGRVAGQLSPDTAVSVAKRLPTPFLAELSLSLDPLRAEAIIAAMPPDRIADVAVELSRRGEFISMARFVDVISDAAIKAVLTALQDNTDLLRIAFFIESKPRLNHILGLLNQARLVAIIEAAASEHDLWPEALGLLEHVDDAWKATLGNLAASLDPQVLNTMIASVHHHDLWAAALPVITHMSPESQSRFANLAPLQTEAVMADLIRAAGKEGLWDQVLPLVPQMNEAGQALAAHLSGQLDGEQLLAVAQAATDQQCWPIVVDLIALMAEDQRQSVFGLLGVAPARALDGLLHGLDAGQQWPLLRAALPSIPAAHQARLLDRATALGYGVHVDHISPTTASTAITPPAARPSRTARPVSPQVASVSRDADIDSLRIEYRQLRSDIARALEARADMTDLLTATAHANKALRQQAQRSARVATVALLAALGAVALAAAAFWF